MIFDDLDLNQELPESVNYMGYTETTPIQEKEQVRHSEPAHFPSKHQIELSFRIDPPVGGAMRNPRNVPPELNKVSYFNSEVSHLW